jgi:hypothetical protein
MASNNMSNERGSEDVDKAWKMLDKAKMMQRTHQGTSSTRQGVDKPSCSGRATKTSFAHCNYPESKNPQPRTSSYLRHPQMENRQSLKFGEKLSRVTCEEMVPRVRDHTAYPEGYFQRPLPRKVHSSNPGVPCHGDGERNVAKEQSRPACLLNSAGSASSHGKSGGVLSNRDADLFNEEKRPAKSFWDENTRTLEDAKTEIRSLVKLNLKFLTSDKKLGNLLLNYSFPSIYIHDHCLLN